MLSEYHHEQLIRSAIGETIVEQRGYATASRREDIRAAGFGKRQERHLPGLMIPLWDVVGNQHGYQYRPDSPRTTKDGKPIKYETPYGMSMFLDCHPSQQRRLADPSQPLWITEGIKKGDSLASADIVCAALMGVWNWRGRNSYDGLKTLADWDEIALNGRAVYIVFDNDLAEKPEVARAIHRLAGVMQLRKARPAVVYLPKRPEKLGIDDYLAEGHCIEEVLALAKHELPEIEEETPLHMLLRLCEGVDVLRTPAHELYAICKVGQHQECIEITERGGFRSWLGHAYQEEHTQHEPPPMDALRRAVEAMANAARFDTEDTEHVFTRMGWKDDRALYIDRGAPTYQAIQITADGWHAVPHALVHFRRPGGQLALPEPQRGGDIRALRPFLNVAPDSADELLIWGWLLACFLPGGPYPHLCLYGPQGSAKSTATRLLRSLIDPHEVPARTTPKDEEALFLAAKNGAILCLENLSSIPKWLSDILCTLSTGGGMSRRGLYTEEEHFLFGKRPAIINGITEMVTRGDLRDRCIFVTLQRVEDESRRDERAFNTDWAHARPLVLGALYEAAAQAMLCWEGTILEKSPRMADMARWVMAGMPAMFVNPEEWLEHYRANQHGATAAELESSGLAGVLLEYLQEYAIAEMKAESILYDIRKWLEIRQREVPEYFPKNASRFGAELSRIDIMLRQLGWRYKKTHSRYGSLYTFVQA